MKQWMISSCAVGMTVMMSGCTTMQGWFDGTIFESKPDPTVARVATTTEQTSLELRRLMEQMNEIQRNQQTLDTRLNRMETQLASGGRTQSEITAMQRDIQMLRADRETLKREIINDLSAKIEKIQQAQRTPAAAPTSNKPRTGYEHKVEKGQTLSEIARGYGKSMDSIMKANNLKDASSLRVGQVLFIPD